MKSSAPMSVNLFFHGPAMTKRQDKTEKIRISYSKVIIYFSGWLPTIRKEKVETKNLIRTLFDGSKPFVLVKFAGLKTKFHHLCFHKP